MIKDLWFVLTGKLSSTELAAEKLRSYNLGQTCYKLTVENKEWQSRLDVLGKKYAIILADPNARLADPKTYAQAKIESDKIADNLDRSKW